MISSIFFSMITVPKIWLALFLLLFVFLHLRIMKRSKSLPPGPPALPILGSVPFLNTKNGHVQGLVDKTLYHFHPKLCTVWIGFIPTIIIQDYQLAKDICSRDEFSGRFVNWRHHGTTDGHSLGLLFSQGKYWKEQRRFALTNLRDLGFGRKSLDSSMIEEVDQVIDQLLYRSPKP